MITSRKLWMKTLKIFIYFIYELQYQIGICLDYAKHNFKALVITLFSTFCFAFIVFSNIPGKPIIFHQLENFIETSLYWIGLGILSSVGLGSGLHTFILYLGPHIARVTLAAYECGSLDFPEPPYPNRILCPYNIASAARIWNVNAAAKWPSRNQSATNNVISMFAILSKVKLAAFMWGLGTAIGELPPYFMARFARLSRDSCQSGDVKSKDNSWSTSSFDISTGDNNTMNLGFIKLFCNKAEHLTRNVIERVGFLGILICASIPNPLFDIAGLTCGHFLVPFWTFFGATFIGKAIIKMHIQVLVVIALFSKSHVKQVSHFVSRLPLIGTKLSNLLWEHLNSQRAQLHGGSGAASSVPKSFIQMIFDWILIGMILYFTVSIITSMSHQYHSRKRLKSDSFTI